MFKTILSFFQRTFDIQGHYGPYSVYWATFDTADMINITLYWEFPMHFRHLWHEYELLLYTLLCKSHKHHFMTPPT